MFRDRAVFEPTTKTALSVCNGVLRYSGAELLRSGALPEGAQVDEHQFYKVYRSPATIANIAPKMPGLAVTLEHVPTDQPPPMGNGEVLDAEMVDVSDQYTGATIAIRNHLDISQTLLPQVEEGIQELSLGYGAELAFHDEYDFEQLNIAPHHLAVVPKGRCGPICSFIDKEPENMAIHKAFQDAEGGLNLAQVVELAAALPEAIKSVPVDQLAQLVEPLQAIVEAAKPVLPEDEVMDEKPDEEVVDEKPDEEKKDFKDSDEFRDALASEVKAHSDVIAKARLFLDAEYQYEGKTKEQIMRDALAKQSSENFTDAELSIAFRVAQPASKYKEFGDSGTPSAFEELKDKERG